MILTCLIRPCSTWNRKGARRLMRRRKTAMRNLRGALLQKLLRRSRHNLKSK